MWVKLRYGLLISILLISGVLIAGCSDQVPADSIPITTTAASNEKYVAGDIIGKTASATETMVYVITKYDSSTDQYTRQMLYKNPDGSWGHFINNRTEKVERTLVEKVYPVKIGHVTVSAIPFVTSTVPPTVATTLSGNAPGISGISPTTGGSDATVSVTISGDNFMSGATVKLLRAGYSVLYATGVSVPSATKIECIFSFSKAEKGSYNLIVTNPDGQSDTKVGAFTLGDSPPVISGVSPRQGALNDTISLTINGQNFKEGVKVTIIKSSTEIVCTSPVSTDSTKILCNLDLKTTNGAVAGDWNVTVLNIDSQQKGTWNQKFQITN
jgi:hypothetical protein